MKNIYPSKDNSYKDKNYKISEKELSEEQINSIINLTNKQSEFFMNIIMHYICEEYLSEIDRLDYNYICQVLISRPEELMRIFSLTAENIGVIIEEILEEIDDNQNQTMFAEEVVSDSSYVALNNSNNPSYEHDYISSEVGVISSFNMNQGSI